MSDYGYKKLTIEEAEKHIGGRLDRRRKYFLWDVWGDGKLVVCQNYKHLHPCHGCYECGEYGVVYCGCYDKKRGMDIGSGCQECGYTGVRWSDMVVPAETIKQMST